MKSFKKNYYFLIGFVLVFFISSRAFAIDTNSPSDPNSEFLFNEIQKRALNYFLEQQNPRNGLIRDSAWNTSGEANAPASVAATGFALTAYGVGVERGWLDRGRALSMVKQTLLFLKDGVPTEHGFFYHFLTFEEGKRSSHSELSPIDTALAAAGILFAAQYFNDKEIQQLAGDILDRIDWPWMLNGGKTFALAWTPETKFYNNRWTSYDESSLLYLLALGSRVHPISPESWKAVKRPIGSYGTFKLMKSPPLFTHQYAHIWFDFRNKNDGYADYFENSVQATLAQRQFATDESKIYKSYGPNSWGFTAAEGPFGYKAYGAPPGWALHDGTIAPTACISSMPFTPKESMACMNFIYDRFKDKLWGRYGFGDSYNIDQKWFSNRVFAINQGPMILMIENYRTGLIWKVMNQLAYVGQAFNQAGFKPGTIDLKWEAAPELVAMPVEQRLKIDADFSDWPVHAEIVGLGQNNIEQGSISSDQDLHGLVSFAWDKNYLYFRAEVADDSLVARSKGNAIWRDDLVEIFINPKGDGLQWENTKDFQIGFRPDVSTSRCTTWSWFSHPGDPSKDGSVACSSKASKDGYWIEGAIRLDFLGIVPQSGQTLRLTMALHDQDMDRSSGKLNFFFRNVGNNKYELAPLVLR